MKLNKKYDELSSWISAQTQAALQDTSEDTTGETSGENAAMFERNIKSVLTLLYNNDGMKKAFSTMLSATTAAVSTLEPPLDDARLKCELKYYHDRSWATTTSLNMTEFIVGRTEECEEFGINVMKHLSPSRIVTRMSRMQLIVVMRKENVYIIDLTSFEGTTTRHGKGRSIHITQSIPNERSICKVPISQLARGRGGVLLEMGVECVEMRLSTGGV